MNPWAVVKEGFLTWLIRRLSTHRLMYELMRRPGLDVVLRDIAGGTSGKR
jgi:hypothetical protein